MNLLNLPMKNSATVKRMSKKEVPKKSETLKKQAQDALPESVKCLHPAKKAKVEDEQGNELQDDEEKKEEDAEETEKSKSSSEMSKQAHKKSAFAGYSSLEKSLYSFVVKGMDESDVRPLTALDEVLQTLKFASYFLDIKEKPARSSVTIPPMISASFEPFTSADRVSSFAFCVGIFLEFIFQGRVCVNGKDCRAYSTLRIEIQKILSKGNEVFQVYSFLRASHALWWLGCVALGLIWSSFFDDFVTFCRHSEADLVAGVIVQFFKLLGWQVSSGDKDLPFAREFKALGVEISLADCQLGFVLFKNTTKRVQELVNTISELLDRGRMTQAEALSLRGRMQFAKAQIWGRAARICLNVVTEHAYGSEDGSLSAATCAAMSTFTECLVTSPPRCISGNLDRPWFVYTDASFQPGNADNPCGLGGVLIGPDGNQISAFSLVLNFDHLLKLGYPSKKTVIFEAELVALILGMHLWSKFVSKVFGLGHLPEVTLFVLRA